MAEVERSEAILKNLAHELLTEDECDEFKEALQQFRVSHSVPSLCQQLKHIINSTPKMLLLIELSSRLPKNLRKDFHKLCSLEIPNYDMYLKILTMGHADKSISRAVTKDSTGKFKIVSCRSEKKVVMRYNNRKQTYELCSLPGTSVTSGIYSNSDETDDILDVSEYTDKQGRATPMHMHGKKNVHKAFLNRHTDGSLGLGITGGKEFGREIIVSVVEEGSPASKQGLLIGDKITEVNGHSFHNITHAEAVTIMQNAWNLIIMVERPLEDKNGADNADAGSRHDRIQDLDVVVFSSGNGRLGCITQRLPNKDLLVMNVVHNSSAQMAGIQTHDLIYKIDNVSVRELSEKQIVMLTDAKRVTISIKRVTLGSSEDSADDTDERTIGYERQKMSVTAEQHGYWSDSSQAQSTKEFHDNRPNSSHHAISNGHTNKTSAQNPHLIKRFLNQKGQLVYSRGHEHEPNWIISSKPREHAVMQNSDANHDSEPSVIHQRSNSAGNNELRDHNSKINHDSSKNTGVGNTRYVRNKSQPSHRNTISRVQNADTIISAIQLGLEKRQRAVRLSLRQMPDPVDYEWEI